MNDQFLSSVQYHTVVYGINRIEFDSNVLKRTQKRPVNIE